MARLERGALVGREGAVAVVLILVVPGFIPGSAVTIPETPAGPYLSEATGLIIRDPTGKLLEPVAVARSHSRTGMDSSWASAQTVFVAGVGIASVYARATSWGAASKTHATAVVTGISILGASNSAAKVSATVAFDDDGTLNVSDSGVYGLKAQGIELGSFTQPTKIEVAGLGMDILQTFPEPGGCVRVRALQVTTADGWGIIAGEALGCPAPGPEPKTRGMAFAQAGMENVGFFSAPTLNTHGVLSTLEWKGEGESETRTSMELPGGAFADASFSEKRAIIGADVYSLARARIEPFTIPGLFSLVAPVEGEAYAHAHRYGAESQAWIDSVALDVNGERVVRLAGTPGESITIFDTSTPPQELAVVRLGDSYNTSGVDGRSGEYVATAGFDILQIHVFSRPTVGSTANDVLIRLGFGFVRAAAPGLPELALDTVATPGVARAGSPVTFTYTTRNVGASPVDKVHLVDSRAGEVESCSTPVLAFRMKLRCSITRIVDPIDNGGVPATVTGEGPDGETVTAEGFAPLRVIDPSLGLTASAFPGEIRSGETTTIAYTVTNTGDSPLHAVLVEDPALGIIATFGELLPGESRIAAAEAAPTETRLFRGAATAFDEIGLPVSAASEVLVTVTHPMIGLTVDAPAAVRPGESFRVTYVVDNLGDVPLGGVVLTDAGTGGVREIGALGIGQRAETTSTGTAGDADVVLAPAVDGHDASGFAVHAAATRTVRVIHPGLALLVTPDPPLLRGSGDVVWSYAVGNTGDSPLSAIDVTDDRTGVVASGLTLLPGEFSIAERTEFVVSESSVTATAHGLDELSGPVVATASGAVRVIHPALSLTATPSAGEVSPGEEVTITYTLMNTGDASLAGLSVVDAVFGVVGTVTELAPGGTAVFAVTTRPDADLAATVEAGGVDELGGSVMASSSYLVDVQVPSLSLDKRASNTVIKAGEPVAYEFLITNTGDTLLSDVRVDDDHLGLVGTVGELAPGRSILFTVDLHLSESTRNNAIATAAAPSVGVIEALDSELVEVVASELPAAEDLEAPTSHWSLVGAAPSRLAAGGTADVSYAITNPSSAYSRVYGLALGLAADEPSRVSPIAGAPAAVRVFAADGAVLYEGSIAPAVALGAFARFDPAGQAEAAIATYRLPPHLYLEQGGRIEATMRIGAGDGSGPARVVAFWPSTEDAFGDDSARPDEAITDFTNMYHARGGWYPLHNSFDAWDEILGGGHAWRQYSWTPNPTSDAFAKAEFTVENG